MECVFRVKIYICDFQFMQEPLTLLTLLLSVNFKEILNMTYHYSLDLWTGIYSEFITVTAVQGFPFFGRSENKNRTRKQN